MHHKIQVVVARPLPLSPQDVHTERKNTLQVNIIMETIADWVDSQDVKNREHCNTSSNVGSR
jgi:hypothetical protein